jgi:outer membrane immunogenic protein
MASTAMAADLIVEEAAVVDVPAAAFDWSGAYIGVNAGYGSLKANQPYADYYGYWYGTDYYGENDDVSGDGFSAGIGAGANAQFGNFVLGIDGDINWTNLEASDSDDVNYAPDVYYEIKSQWDWYATLRAKAGFAVDNALFYVTAGVAAVNATYSYCETPGYCEEDYDSSFTNTIFGVAAGVGAEIAVADNVTVKGEVLYVGLPEQTYLTPYYEWDGSEYDGNFTTSAVIGRVGLNWHF